LSEFGFELRVNVILFTKLVYCRLLSGWFQCFQPKAILDEGFCFLGGRLAMKTGVEETEIASRACLRVAKETHTKTPVGVFLKKKGENTRTIQSEYG
jgi:hypothetical protein